MDNRKCVVILYSKGIYDSAALAVAEYLEKNHSKDIYVCPVSDDELSPWRWARVRKKSYIFATRNFPIINKWTMGVKHLFSTAIIKATKREFKDFKKPAVGNGNWWYRWKSKYRRVYNALARFEPEMVLCSTPELLMKANRAKHNLDQFNMSVCALITDYQLDKNFVNFKADGYFVQNNSIKLALMQYGIEEDSVTVVGTPISERVKTVYNREEVLKEYGIEESRLNIALIGGRYGSAKLKEVFTRCLETSSEFNLILITGESDSISKYCTYSATSKNMLENVYIIDKLDEMAKIYALADIIIALPTAQITYEAMYHHKKIIVVKGSDKIENLNAHYLTTNSLALRGLTPDEVMASIFKFVEDNEFSAQVRKEEELVAVGDCSASLGELIVSACAVHFEAKRDIENKRKQILTESKVALKNSEPNATVVNKLSVKK